VTLLTVAEVAGRLNLSPSAVYRHLAPGGQLRAYRIGFSARAAIRISEKDLDRYIERCAVEPGRQIVPRVDRRFSGKSEFEIARAEVERGRG
jgi:excisionase family DNA binding protein